jgi:molybdopterin biosynthesis enzyme
LGTVSDHGTDIDSLFRQAVPRCQIIVSTGGVSMGQLDLIKPYLESEGKVFFGRLNMKPGKPTTFAKL